MANDLWSEKCYKLCHHYILKYTKDTNIPPEWVAGLIGVECARLQPTASRFEAHVYESVMWVKKGNKSTAFPGFNEGRIRNFILGTSNIDKLKSLATSYGLGQIMGYHYVDKWGLEPEEYMNLTFETSIKYTVLFMRFGMKFVKFPYLDKNGKKYQPYEQLMRWHNSGSTTGTTYHPSYYQNAQQMADKYKKYAEMMETNINADKGQIFE